MRRFLTHILLLWLLALVPAGAAGLFHPKRPGWRSFEAVGAPITVSDSLRLEDNVLWIDLRSRSAFDEKHISGAVPLGPEQWEEQFSGIRQAWHPGLTMVLYCDAAECDSDRRVAWRINSEAGIEDIRVLKGGWVAWQAYRQ